MTAGAGICHSEVSTANTTVLHGLQLWVALPDSARDTDRDFAHYAPQPHTMGGATVRVFLGELEGHRSPVHTFTPLLGAQIDLEPGAEVTLDIDETFEHGVLLDQGDVEACGSVLAVADLAYQAPGHGRLHLANRGDGPARAVLLGGTPFDEQLVMWWNFVGRSHDDIVTYREQWQNHDDRFGSVDGYRGAVTRLPAPPLPNGRLRPRANPGV
jgi:redox-sensitive bicupin YhaK (pirin superfamily)